MANLLVVDDNKTNLQVLKQLLSKEYNVVPVLSGKMALHYIEKKRPDVILLDLLMPEMDGITTMEHIRRLPNGKDIPIIFLTADDDKRTEQSCLDAGAYDFIVKPFDYSVINSRIDQAIQSVKLNENRKEGNSNENNRI
ncbi:MAG: response regulator [bacterium]|nr:response regulator [bacterium]